MPLACAIPDVRRRCARPSGLTLIEVLMVVAILGIAATIVISTTGDTSDLQVRAAARELTSVLLYAQTLAIAAQQTRQVVFDDVQHGYQVQDSDGNVITDPVNNTGMQMTFPTNKNYRRVTIANININGTSAVAFNDLGAPLDGNGDPLNTAANVTLAAGTIQIRIDVEPVSGKINLTEL